VPSPYEGVQTDKWPEVTARLIKAHPLSTDALVRSVLTAWTELHATKIGSRELQIGKSIFPNPQILGFLLHELIPVELAALHPSAWRREALKGEKDLVYVPDPQFSIEIKTSSHTSQIFGNRSYAQRPTGGTSTAKAGYFLTVNFQAAKKDGEQGKITRIRFGWLDHSDWIGQQSQTGQQARLSADADKYKLVQIYPALAKAKVG
jgi:ScaI restriction endonuclease